VVEERVKDYWIRRPLHESLTHIARVVHEAGVVPTFGGVDDVVGVDPEQVGAADALPGVDRLPPVRHTGPDQLPHVLDHHFVGANRLLGEQPPPMDATPAELHALLAELDTIVIIRLAQIRIRSKSRT